MTDNNCQRLIFVITGLSTGGAQMMLYKLLTLIDRSRFDPVVISLMDKGKLGDRIESLNIPVYAINMQQRSIIVSIKDLIFTVQQLKPDLLQGWMAHGNLAAQLAAIFLPQSVPVLWNIRHLALTKVDAKARTLIIIKLLACLSSLPVKIIYNSKLGAIQHEKIGYCNRKTVIIPNGFDLQTFSPSLESRSDVRAELNLTIDAFIIGLFGRFDVMKDHANFLQAVKLLLSLYPQVHFLLVGAEIELTNKYLAQLIDSLNLFERVHLLGERQDIPRLTAALDIATSASFSEGFANVIGEAMACAVPCTVTDVGDSAWIVGDTGKVVNPKDPQALCNAWVELIEMGKEARANLGKKARQRIEENYALSAIVKQYEKLYE